MASRADRDCLGKSASVADTAGHWCSRSPKRCVTRSAQRTQAVFRTVCLHQQDLLCLPSCGVSMFLHAGSTCRRSRRIETWPFLSQVSVALRLRSGAFVITIIIVIFFQLREKFCHDEFQAVRCILLLKRHSENIDRFVLLFSAVYQIPVYVWSSPKLQITEHGTSTETVYKDCNDLERQYRSEAPRVPEAFAIRKLFSIRPRPFFRTGLTATHLYLNVRSYGGAKTISKPAWLLAAASVFPFVSTDGFSLAVNGLQPFMVWEHGQFWRLLTSVFLHNNENHLLANLAGLVLPNMILGEEVSNTALTAQMLSLGVLANGIYGKRCITFMYPARCAWRVAVSVVLQCCFQKLGWHYLHRLTTFMEIR